MLYVEVWEERLAYMDELSPIDHNSRLILVYDPKKHVPWFLHEIGFA